MIKTKENIKESTEALSRVLLSMSEFIEMSYKIAGESGGIRNLHDITEYSRIIREISESLYTLALTESEIEILDTEIE